MICIGDSLTCGMIGHSYIEYCDIPERIINKGVNGDTTRCALERLEKYIKSPAYKDEGLYVVAIGTNDILLPYLARLSSAWKTETGLRCRIKKCIDEDMIFSGEYEEYLQILKAYDKKIITISIPYIQLTDFPQERVRRRNRLIEELSLKYGAVFIDMYGMQLEAAGVTNSGSAQEGLKLYTWKHRNILRLFDNLAMLIFPSVKDMLSGRRHLELTVDGVHYNSLSAGLLGRQVQKAAEEIFAASKSEGKQE